MISAARAASAGLASSAGWWLIPSLQGTNTIAHDTRSATHIVSCAAPAGMVMYGSPPAPRRPPQRVADPRVHWRRGERLPLLVLGAHPATLRRCLREGRDVARHAAV